MSDISLNLSLLKHSDIREQIKQYLKDKYDITYTDGSNFNYIVETLSILNMYMSYQLTTVAKNLTLSAVNDRSIAVSNAQRLGYTTKKIIPATISGNFKISITSATLSMTGIKLAGSVTGLNFVVDDIAITDLSEYEIGTNLYSVPFQAKQVEQRTIKTKLPSSLKIYIDSDKIAEEEITVTVGGTLYENYNSFDAIPSSTDEVFFISEDTEKEGRLYIEFGNGVIGASVATDTEVAVVYYVSEGSNGNEETDLTLTGYTPVPALDDITITDTLFSYGGRSRETIEEIKSNAPRYYSTKNRLVTAKDYDALLKKLVDTDIRYFSIIDMYSTENIENFYKLGNIYISIVPDDIYTTNNVIADVITNGQTLPYEYINNITYSDAVIESLLANYEDNFIISTNRVIISPTYLYMDIYPYIEFANKSYNINQYNIDNLPTFLEYGQDIEGLNSTFREEDFKSLIMEDSKVKSVDVNVDFSILTNKTNILDTYFLSLPKNFIISTRDARDIDNKYLGYSYNLVDMPDTRKSVYGVLDESTEGFVRTLVSDNTTSENSTMLAHELIITVPETLSDIDTFDYYKSMSYDIINPDGSLNSIVVKTRTDYNTDDPYYFPLITGTGTDSDKIPVTYDEGSSSYNTTTNITDEEKFFVYYKSNSTHYLLATISYSEVNDIVSYNINYRSVTSSSNSTLYNILYNNNLVMKNGRSFLGVIDYTYNLSDSEIEEPTTKISMYLLSNDSVEQQDEYIKIKSRKIIGTLYTTANKKMMIREVQSPFASPTKTEDAKYEYLTFTVDTGDTVLILRKNKATGLIELDKSTTVAYPGDVAYVNFKDHTFEIINNVLYCVETIHNTIIGYNNKSEGRLVFNDLVYYNNTYNTLHTFFDTYGIMDGSCYRLNIRNDFEISDEKLKYLNNIDGQGGICCLYNIHNAVKM